MNDAAPCGNARTNFRSRETWVRIFYVVVFAFIIGVTFWVVWAVVLLQVGWSLIAGKANANLCRFGADLGDFVRQVLDYLTYNSEIKPFPFAPWPASSQGGPAAPGARSADGSEN